MRKCNGIIGATLAALVFTVISAYADTLVSGQVSGTWTAIGSPYIVVADLDIPFGQTLTIDPGVQVRFAGQFRFNAHGTLTAVGTPTDSILFTHQVPDPTQSWRGIFLDSTQGISEIAYCTIERGYARGNAGQNQAKGGGIHVRYASANIHHNRIWRCTADVKGGGIYINHATCEINDNLITLNLSNSDGGGIFAEYCDAPYIHDNIITRNSATIGGSIHYFSCNGIIENNIINYNWVGLYLGSSSPLVQYNVINHNVTMGPIAGTGIFCSGNSNPLIRYNEVCWNLYAGIAGDDNCNLQVIGNTLYGNELLAVRVTQNSTVSGTDNIAYGSPSTFYASPGCDINMTYSDIANSWPGVGNISAPPNFVNTLNDDFHLQPNSPCINAGNPTSPLDPDSTRADMGAHAFDLTQPQGTCTITLTPSGAPIVLPPQGGTVAFTVSIHNSPDHYNLFDVWIKLTQPGGQIVPLVNRLNLYLPAGGQINRTVSININASSPAGTYSITGYVGTNPNIIESQDSFTFEKQSGGSPGNEPAWVFYDDGEISQTVYLKSELPQETRLIGHFPEPFNPQTIINFELGETSPVTLEIYTIAGQKVGTLLNRVMGPGLYHQSFDGSSLVSGIYFYTLNAGNYQASGKMALIK